MAPKKAATTLKGANSKKGKGKANVKAQMHVDSDSEYFADDLPIFEEPPTVTIETPTPKKRKGVATTSMWINKLAQKRWEDGLPVKKLHLERAFTVDKGPFKKLMQFHKFDKKLTTAPAFCNVSIAREFYANGKYPNDDGVVYVRGVWVVLTSELSNEYLGTPSFPTDPFECPEEEDGDQDLLNELAHPGAVWVVNQRGEHKHVRHQFRKSDVKLCLMFVLSRLMPSSQVTEVLRKRLYLISAIKERRSIDVGRIILNDIAEGIEDNNAAIYFPLLLEELCKAQGVNNELGGDWRPTKLPIAPALYKKYLNLDREMMKAYAAAQGILRDDFEPPVHSGQSEQQPHLYDFRSFQNSLNDFQHSIENSFICIDERLEVIHENIGSMQQEWTSHAEHMDHRLDDLSSIAQQQFEVLYHRQMVMQLELDKCNKMAVYYHSESGPPKPTPTSAQLAGYRIPNLTRDEISGAIHELPPGVPAVSSLGPLPTFCRIPPIPPTPTFLADPQFFPATRIPMFGTGQPLHGPIVGPFHYTASPLTGSSFSTTAYFSTLSSSAPSSS